MVAMPAAQDRQEAVEKLRQDLETAQAGASEQAAGLQGRIDTLLAEIASLEAALEQQRSAALEQQRSAAADTDALREQVDSLLQEQQQQQEKEQQQQALEREQQQQQREQDEKLPTSLSQGDGVSKPPQDGMRDECQEGLLGMTLGLQRSEQGAVALCQRRN